MKLVKTTSVVVHWPRIEASVDDDEYGSLLMNNGAAMAEAERGRGNVALSIPIEDQ